jgi:hypothetical protein
MTVVAWRRTVLILATGVAGTSACNSGEAEGPLRQRGAGTVAEAGAFAVNVGEPQTFGEAAVLNFGDEPARLDSVEMVDPSQGIAITGAMAAIRDGEPPYNPGGYAFWPPPSTLNAKPLSGFTVPPRSELGDRGVQILLGLELSRGDRATFRALAINYHVGEERFQYVFPYAVALCARQEAILEDPGRCPAPDPPTDLA